MSTPNTCQTCETEYRNEDGHTCDPKVLAELLDEANERIAEYGDDSDRLDWLDADDLHIDAVIGYLDNHSDADVRDAIDELRELEQDDIEG
jgi:hypothetical protein